MPTLNKEFKINIIGHAVTAIGLVISVILYNCEQTAISEREFKGRIHQEILKNRRTEWEKQREIYSKMAGISGNISAYLYKNKKLTVDEIPIQNLFDDFYTVYFGSIVLVEDKEVRNALNYLHLDIKNYRENKKSLIVTEKPEIKIIRSCNYLIEVLKKSSLKYRQEILIYQNEILNK